MSEKRINTHASVGAIVSLLALLLYGALVQTAFTWLCRFVLPWLILGGAVVATVRYFFQTNPKKP